MADPNENTVTPDGAPGAESPASDPAPAGAADAPVGAVDGGSPLQAAQAEVAQLKDAWLRALADAENIRKHARADVANAHKYAIEGFASDLLAVKDTLEMALADKTSSADQIRMGVDLTLKNLATAFEKAKIVESNPLNQKFDPNLHQAVSQVDSNQPPNTVVQVFQKGYRLQDRVLRPAMVAVARQAGDGSGGGAGGQG